MKWYKDLKFWSKASMALGAIGALFPPYTVVYIAGKALTIAGGFIGWAREEYKDDTLKEKLPTVDKVMDKLPNKITGTKKQ
jgi:hypothetical protein